MSFFLIDLLYLICNDRTGHELTLFFADFEVCRLRCLLLLETRTNIGRQDCCTVHVRYPGRPAHHVRTTPFQSALCVS